MILSMASGKENAGRKFPVHRLGRIILYIRSYFMAEKKQISPKEKWRKRGLRAGIILLSLFAFLLLLDKVIMPWYVKRGEVTVLPKVVGKQVDEAIHILQSAG